MLFCEYKGKYLNVVNFRFNEVVVVASPARSVTSLTLGSCHHFQYEG